MPHGAPDDSNVVKIGAPHRLDDMAELAVRMGSPNLWDRRGEEVWSTTFKHGMGDVSPVTGGAGNAIALFTGYARQGAFCLQLRPGPAAADSIGIRKALPLPVVTGWGLEFSFSSYPTVQRVLGALSAIDADGIHMAEVGLEMPTRVLYYCDDTGTRIPIVTVKPLANVYATSQVIKFVIDHSTRTYRRAIYNGHTYPLTGIEYEFVGGAAADLLYAYVVAFEGVAEESEVYIDNVIVTQNEP